MATIQFVSLQKLLIRLHIIAFGEKNYNYYSAYLRKKYHGKNVYKVIVDAGFTCPREMALKVMVVALIAM